MSQELSFEAGARRVKQAEVQAAPGEDRQLSSPRQAHIQPHTRIFGEVFLNTATEQHNTHPNSTYLPLYIYIFKGNI